MAASKLLGALLPLLLLYCCTPTAGYGGVTCESLEANQCAYAVSSAGLRCVLERSSPGGGDGDGGGEYVCNTSEIDAEGFADWIETEACIVECGLRRTTVGISSDLLLDAAFTRRLCAPGCYLACPNIINLFFNLAAAEGVFLPDLCVAFGGIASAGQPAASAPAYVDEHRDDYVAYPPFAFPFGSPSAPSESPLVPATPFDFLPPEYPLDSPFPPEFPSQQRRLLNLDKAT